MPQNSSVLEWYNRYSYKVGKIVDTTFFRLLQDNTSTFNEIAPIQNYVDVMLLIMKFSRSKPTIASLVGDEQEIPQGRARITITEEILSEARFGKQYIFKNNDYKAMKRLEDALTRAQSPELINAFESVFLGLAADLAPAIIEKMTVLLMQTLTTGSCNFVDPLTGIRFILTYPDVVTSGAYQLMFTNEPLAGDDWTNPAANGLAQIESHAYAYYQNFGVYPSRMYMRQSQIRLLANQNSTKLAVAQQNGYAIVSSDATALASMYVDDRTILDLIQGRIRGGTIKFIDGMYSEESDTGIVTDKYFLSDKYYFFNEPGIAERSFIPTPEKDFMPGIYVNARLLNDAPRQERIAGVGSGIPSIFDSRKLAARKVVAG